MLAWREPEKFKKRATGLGSATTGAPSRARFRLLRACYEHVWERLFVLDEYQEQSWGRGIDCLRAQRSYSGSSADDTGSCAEIVEVAADPSRKMSELFSEAAIQVKVGACVELALAVAACRRCKWLRAVRAEIEATADVVIAADNALSPCLTLNPETMSHVQCVELKIFDLMISASPLILALAKLAQIFKPYFIAYLHKEFVDIRIQLRLTENGGKPVGGRPRKGWQAAFTQKAVAVLCGKDVNTIARWESGAIKAPLDYTAELRKKGDVGFFDWIREYNAHNGVVDIFIQIQKGNVAYTEGLTEREKGLVEEYIQALRQG